MKSKEMYMLLFLGVGIFASGTVFGTIINSKIIENTSVKNAINESEEGVAKGFFELKQAVTQEESVANQLEGRLAMQYLVENIEMLNNGDVDWEEFSNGIVDYLDEKPLNWISKGVCNEVGNMFEHIRSIQSGGGHSHYYWTPPIKVNDSQEECEKYQEYMVDRCVYYFTYTGELKEALTINEDIFKQATMSMLSDSEK